MSLKKTLIKLALMGMVAASSAWAGEVVLNGGFETGDLTDWTLGSGASWEVSSGSAFAGSFFATTGCVGAQCITGSATQQAALSQVLTDTAGSTYTLTFEFNTGNNGTPNELDVLWNGVSVLDLGSGGTLGVVGSSGVYDFFSVSGLVGTGSDKLTFLGRQDPGFNQLDNVSVTNSSSAVPEPSTFVLIGGILPVLAILRRRRLS